MPFTSRITPEALLPRSDSRNPAKTCRGITSNGRPCRRAIAARVQAYTEELGPSSYPPYDTFLYCWQHKDQASNKSSSPPPPPPQQQQQNDRNEPALPPLQERTSIDTLVERLGGLDVKSKDLKHSKHPRKPEIKEDGLPSSHKNAGQTRAGGRNYKEPSRPHPAGSKHKQNFWASLCCIAEDEDDDYIEIVRHQRRSEGPQKQESEHGMSAQAFTPSQMPASGGRRPHRMHDPSLPKAHGQKSASETHDFTTPSSPPSLLSYIPQSLSPQTASILLAELSKPISSFDEPGYIYIFWLTDSAISAPSTDDTTSLLVPPSSNGNGSDSSQRRRSEVLRQFSTSKPPERRAEMTSNPASTSAAGGFGAANSRDRTILLKIGRASNVHRRMSEWSRQCGYNVSLVRFYPYRPTSSLRKSSSPSQSRQPSPRPTGRSMRPLVSPSVDDGSGIRKVPYSHRVERLVHIELAGRGMRAPAGTSRSHSPSGNGRCLVCGREHREWFEVEATRNALKSVDEMIRRWVRWAEAAADSQGASTGTDYETG